MRTTISVKDLDFIDQILSELISNETVTPERIIEIVGDEENARRLFFLLKRNGSACEPKYYEGMLIKSNLTEEHYELKYYRNHYDEAVKRKEGEAAKAEQMRLEIDKLKRERWIAPLALAISMIAGLIGIASFVVSFCR